MVIVKQIHAYVTVDMLEPIAKQVIILYVFLKVYLPFIIIESSALTNGETATGFVDDNTWNYYQFTANSEVVLKFIDRTR
jgi:ABC-type spermidine/putrescine transport system permease subunit II